jgi:hypothetical protein
MSCPACHDLVDELDVVVSMSPRRFAFVLPDDRQPSIEWARACLASYLGTFFLWG